MHDAYRNAEDAKIKAEQMQKLLDTNITPLPTAAQRSRTTTKPNPLDTMQQLAWWWLNEKTSK